MRLQRDNTVKLWNRQGKLIMHRVPLSPRNLKKLGQEKILKKFLPIPDRWEDFARLCRIKSGNQMVFFNPYSYQIQLSDLMDNYNNITVVKSRQLGISRLKTR